MTSEEDSKNELKETSEAVYKFTEENEEMAQMLLEKNKLITEKRREL